MRVRAGPGPSDCAASLDDAVLGIEVVVFHAHGCRRGRRCRVRGEADRARQPRERALNRRVGEAAVGSVGVPTPLAFGGPWCRGPLPSPVRPAPGIGTPGTGPAAPATPVAP